MSGRTSENMFQVYVLTQIWITRVHVCTNGILWMASCFLFYLAYCSKYCWLNYVFVQGSEFRLKAMAKVVVECPDTIFIGTANQVATGVEHVWGYKLTFLGAECMYVCMEPPSTTHAGEVDVRSRATYAEPAQAPHNRDVVVALQTLLHFWTQLRFGGGVSKLKISNFQKKICKLILLQKTYILVFLKVYFPIVID